MCKDHGGVESGDIANYERAFLDSDKCQQLPRRCTRAATDQYLLQLASIRASPMLLTHNIPPNKSSLRIYIVSGSANLY